MSPPAGTVDAAPDGASDAALLDARVCCTRGAFSLDLALTAAAGQVVALVGPNGAGKSTALRALAGLVPLARGGRIVLDGAVVDAPGEVRAVAPQLRGVGMVFQDYLLFPHLSVIENVAFGLRSRGVPRREARAAAADWLAAVELAEYAGRKPRQLSGGQAQRVALARALAPRPRLLLLDEPLAALDATTRGRTRTLLRRHLAAFAGVAVLVSHDPLDAMVLADRIIVVEDGREVQQGTPAEVARRPRTPYVAGLVGLNLLRGTANGHQVVVRGAGSRGDHGGDEGGALVVAVAEATSGEVFAAFPPTAVALHRHRPEGSPRNVWPVTVDGLEWHGDRVRVLVRGAVELIVDLTPSAVADLAPTPGMALWASVKALQVHAYPA